MELSDPDESPSRRLTMSEAVASEPEAEPEELAAPDPLRLPIRDDRRELFMLLMPDMDVFLL
jgi:hypothetical protein